MEPTRPSEPDLAPLRALPQRRHDTWRVFPIVWPGWVKTREGSWVRQRAVGLCSTLDAQTRFVVDRTGEPGAEPDLLAHFASFAQIKEIARLPGRVAVADAATFGRFADALTPLGVEVDQLPHADERRERAAAEAELLRRARREHPDPSLFERKEITLERARAFAEAAAEFFRAPTWRELTHEDYLEVLGSAAPDGLRQLSVLGGPRTANGLRFYVSRDDFEDFVRRVDRNELERRPRWIFWFVPLDQLPDEEAERWLEHDLPRANEDAFPLLFHHVRERAHRRPGAARLAFAEGLLRALARSTPEQMDTGRWSVTVPTCEGERVYELALPDLLEARPRPRRPVRRYPPRDQALLDQCKKGLPPPVYSPERGLRPGTPAYESARLESESRDALGRRKRILLRRAVALAPNNSLAWRFLAGDTPDVEEELVLRRRAVEAARAAAAGSETPRDSHRADGEEDPLDVIYAGPLAELHLALVQLGIALQPVGLFEESVEVLSEALRTLPDDIDLVVQPLALALVRLGRDAEAAAVPRLEAERFLGPDELIQEHTVFWAYLDALLAFRAGGDGPQARAALAAALQLNPNVAAAMWAKEKQRLSGKPEPRPTKPEAKWIKQGMFDAWETTAGALAWMMEQVLDLMNRRKQERRERGA